MFKSHKAGIAEKGYVFGWLRFSGQSDLSQTCILKEENGFFRVDVPFRWPKSEVSSWFLPTSGGGDLSGGLPDRIWIVDSDDGECYSLVGCRVASRSVRYVEGETCDAHGTMYPDYVVKGIGSANCAEIGALRSSFRELYRWAGLNATEVRLESDGSCESFPDVRLAAPYVEIPGLFLLSKIASDPGMVFSGFGISESVEIHPYAYFETVFGEQIGLSKAVSIHRHLLNLFIIMYWRDISFESIELFVDDDPKGEGAQYQHGQMLMCSELLSDKSYDGRPLFFGFEDVGPEGLKAWMDLREVFSRPLDGVVSVARFSSFMTLESAVETLCTVLGEIIDLECKAGGGGAPYAFREKMVNLMERLRSAWPHLGLPDPGDLPCEMTNTYNSVKHTESERGGLRREDWLRPDNLYDVVLACRFLVAAWVAMKIGCPEEKVAWFFEHDVYRGLKERWPFFQARELQ